VARVSKINTKKIFIFIFHSLKCKILQVTMPNATEQMRLIYSHLIPSEITLQWNNLTKSTVKWNNSTANFLIFPIQFFFRVLLKILYSISGFELKIINEVWKCEGSRIWKHWKIIKSLHVQHQAAETFCFKSCNWMTLQNFTSKPHENTN
jgi:hypothetical protein